MPGRPVAVIEKRLKETKTGGKMHKLIASMTIREFLVQQVPGITLSIIIAELFYKFHSFTLECLAFMVTWYVIDLVCNMVIKIISGSQPTREP